MACYSTWDPGNCGCGCALQVQVKGCGSPALAVGSGLTVDLKVGASTIDSQTTNGSGIAAFTQPAGTYDVVVTDGRGTSRWNTQTFSSQSLTCGGTTTVTLTSVKAGFHCLDCCGDPLADTLNATDPNGTWTLTYDGAHVSGAGWYGCATHTSMASVITNLLGATCVHVTGTADVHYLIQLPAAKLLGNCIVRDFWGAANSFPATTASNSTCTAGVMTYGTGLSATCAPVIQPDSKFGVASVTCPPSLSITATITGTGLALGTVNPGSGAVTITE